MKIELRPEYQLPAHIETINHCKTSLDFAAHDQAVNSGKSYQICFFAKHVVDKGGKSLVISRQSEIIEQNAQDYWDIGGRCSIFSASLDKKSTYYPCVMGTEGTIVRSLQSTFKNEVYNLIQIDEAHHLDDINTKECIEFMESGGDFYNAKTESGKPKFCDYAKIIAHFKKLNPKLRVIGYSGSWYRGSRSLIGEDGLWKRRLSHVTTHQLVELGFSCPYKFGFSDDEHHYKNMERFNKASEVEEFTKSELAAIGREICKQKDVTQLIMEEVIERTKKGLGVLITCASKKHCEQVSEFLPKGTWGIVTDSTGSKERRETLKKAKLGELKYIIQIGCLSTGINCPYWQYCVILRNIGSLSYLIQLVGRILRRLKPHEIEKGWEKHDATVLDYTDTLERLSHIFDNPIINDAAAALAGKKQQTQDCPACGTENSEFAVRCRGASEDSDDGRCEHFFRSSTCLNCGTENAPNAKECRKCKAIMIDPSLALNNKAYTDADYKPVLSMDLSETRNGKLCVAYRLNSVIKRNGREYPEVAKEYLNPFANPQPYEKAQWRKFVDDHIKGDMFQRTFRNSGSIDALIKNKAMLDVPTDITHRINDKNFSIINRKRFRSGREEIAT